MHFFLYLFAQIEFFYQSDFDQNGIFYWIGTNGCTAEPWLNPAKNNLVLVRSSDGRKVGVVGNGICRNLTGSD